MNVQIRGFHQKPNDWGDKLMFEMLQKSGDELYSRLEKIVPEAAIERSRAVFNYNAALEKLELDGNSLSQKLIQAINKAVDEGRFHF